MQAVIPHDVHYYLATLHVNIQIQTDSNMVNLYSWKIWWGIKFGSLVVSTFMTMRLRWGKLNSLFIIMNLGSS